jgi:class 3 adenylate cyclase
VTEDIVTAARTAFDRHGWREAFDAYRQAEKEGASLEPADLDRLAQSAWWISHIDDCLDARERSFTGYLKRGEEVRAAYEALWLARDNIIRRRSSIGMGWFRRCERLLEGKPESVEHAHLEQLRSMIAAADGQLEAAAAHAARAVELGARFGDRDIQARALSNQGDALVAQGRVDEGMALLEEATVAAVSGELGPMATGIVYCNMISVCANMADYRRAGEWTEAAKRWCERQAISGFPGVCRVHRAEVVRLRGQWGEAEREARVASEELMEHGVMNHAAAAFAEIGMVRLRMGDLDAAEEAFQQAQELGTDPEPGLAMVRMGRGNVAGAHSQLRRALEQTGPPLSRARLLPSFVDVAAATGDLHAARQAAKELAEIAARYNTPMLQASAACAEGAVALAAGNAATAVERFRAGIRHWRETEAPYEAARAQELLGAAFRSDGDEAAALLELGAARAGFERLGATLDAARLSEAMGDRAGSPRRVVRTFMFTDIVGSTNLIEAIGDEAWEDVRGWHHRALRAAFAAHHGEEVDHAGDGFFVAFHDAGQAIECAVGIQRLLTEHRRTHGFAPRVRIGLHADHAVQGDSGYGGRGVHQAARVGALAEGEQILATEETVEVADGRWPTTSAREVQVKGISGTVRVVEVNWR